MPPRFANEAFSRENRRITNLCRSRHIRNQPDQHLMADDSQQNSNPSDTPKRKKPDRFEAARLVKLE